MSAEFEINVDDSVLYCILTGISKKKGVIVYDIKYAKDQYRISVAGDFCYGVISCFIVNMEIVTKTDAPCDVLKDMEQKKLNGIF